MLASLCSLAAHPTHTHFCPSPGAHAAASQTPPDFVRRVSPPSCNAPHGHCSLVRLTRLSHTLAPTMAQQQRRSQDGRGPAQPSSAAPLPPLSGTAPPPSRSGEDLYDQRPAYGSSPFASNSPDTSTPGGPASVAPLHHTRPLCVALTGTCPSLGIHSQHPSAARPCASLTCSWVVWEGEGCAFSRLRAPAAAAKTPYPAK